MKSFRTLVPLCAIILCCLVFPLLIGDQSTNSIAVEVLLLTGAAVAWNIFSGYTGYISLGHATYYGLGAYILALGCQDWHIPGGYGPFLLLPLAGLGAGVFSIPLGWLALRTRQYTFMIITIAIFSIFQLLAYNLQGITGGSAGIFLPFPTWSDDLSTVPFYYVALALLLLVILVSWWIRHAKYGLVLLAIRDDEDRVRSLGIRVGCYKLGAYVLSAVFTGMIGALAIYFTGLITPSSAFDRTIDISIITMTFLGGVGTVAGPVVGGLLLEPLQTYLNQQLGIAGSGINQMLFGCFLLVVILLLPQGIVPSLHQRWSVWRASRQLAPSPALKIPVQMKASPVPVLIRQQSNTASLPIPHRPSQELPVVRRGSTQKVRSQRLVPISANASLSFSGKIPAPPVVTWRCPNCQRPFLLKDGICYCPRCGTMRPLTTTFEG
jgi:branched-chain amino acid transport system permease protein